MQHNAKFHLGLHCLPKYPLIGVGYKIKGWQQKLGLSEAVDRLTFYLWSNPALNMFESFQHYALFRILRLTFHTRKQDDLKILN